MKPIDQMTDQELLIALSSQTIPNVYLDPSEDAYDEKLALALATPDGIDKVKEYEKSQLGIA